LRRGGRGFGVGQAEQSAEAANRGHHFDLGSEQDKGLIAISEQNPVTKITAQVYGDGDV
jgi:hypothetical protein